MDFIKRKAENFIDEHFTGGIESAESVTREARLLLSDLHTQLDKVRFLNFILEKNNLDYSQHLKVCKNKEDCRLNYEYEGVTYYLSQELSRFGVQVNDDMFTAGEKVQVESKLDQVLKDLNEVKLGQEILFAELNEMRDLFFLGKKRWYQLVIGKSIEMTASGVISETVSKQIVEVIKGKFTSLIG